MIDQGVEALARERKRAPEDAWAIYRHRLALVRAGRWQEALPYQAGDLVEVLESQGSVRLRYSTKPWRARLDRPGHGVGPAGWDAVLVGRLDLDGDCAPENWKKREAGDPVNVWISTRDRVTLLEPATPGNS